MTKGCKGPIRVWWEDWALGGLGGDVNYQNLLVTHLRLITSTIEIKSFQLSIHLPEVQSFASLLLPCSLLLLLFSIIIIIIIIIILPTKMGVLFLTDEYLFIRKDFMNKYNKLTSFPLHRNT